MDLKTHLFPFLVFAFLPSVWAQIDSSGSEKPNIALLVADDLGCGELGCQGNGEIPTPHIDPPAENGIRFNQG